MALGPFWGPARGRCRLWDNQNHLGVISKRARSITEKWGGDISPANRVGEGDAAVQRTKRKFARSRRARTVARTQQVRSQRTKLTVWNGLTAEGLASPLVRVTRLCEVVRPSSWCLEERNGEEGGGGGRGKSTPFRRQTRIASRSSHPAGVRPAAPSVTPAREKKKKRD